jgi:alkylated DNA repair protein (DNA oxidative demethylase)
VIADPFKVDLFDSVSEQQAPRQQLADGAVLLRGLAARNQSELVAALHDVVAAAPFRHMVTPGGHECRWR